MSYGRIVKCPDSSAAIEEALRQKAMGNKVSVGREPFEDQWYVRIVEPKANNAAQGA